MTRKQLIIATLIAGAGSLGIMGLASAATGAKPASLAQELAQKFNLKQSDVQTVIDNHRSETRGYREQRYEDRLAQAVTDGKLTPAQKDQILAKHKELQDFAASLKDKTPAERRTALRNQRAEIQSWEKANSIPAGYLGGMGRGFGHRSRDNVDGGASRS
jgi:DNA-binding MarR family transcriptional regulator